MDYSRDLGLVSDISLCKLCREREGISVELGSCYICNGLMDRLNEFFDLIRYATKEYEFSTFSLGLTLPAEIIEREDEVRARLKIKGKKSIKNEITFLLSKELSKVSNARFKSIEPDINIHLDLRTNTVTVRSKAIYLFGMYKKFERGIEQRIKKCKSCKGRGCHVCEFKGSKVKSVEGIISSHLINLYNADKIKFSWIGGEDENSLVINGRPFFVKIVNPRRRSIDVRNIVIKNGIEAWFLREVNRFPERAIRFKTRFRINVYCEDKVDPTILSSTNLDEVVINEKKNKIVKKRIYQLHPFKIDDNTFELEVLVDSGLPIKKFVEGNGVKPNLSILLNKNLKCRYFDVIEVILED